MIEYFIETECKTKKQKDSLDEEKEHISLATKHVNTKGMNPAKRASSHWGVLKKSKHLSNANTKVGRWFTMVVVDALVAAGVAPSSIKMNYDPTKEDKELDCDLDILVFAAQESLQNVVLYCKTSLRERWKQADRDAMLADHYLKGKSKTYHALITWKEKPESTLEDVNKKTAETKRKCFRVNDCISLLQSERFDDLVKYTLEQAAQVVTDSTDMTAMAQSA